MKHSERHDRILSYMKGRGEVSVGELAAALYVSETTTRRTLTEMEGLGLLERTHGGAVLHENADDISVFIRVSKNAKEKELAASAALPQIPDFQTLFLDSSTTALAMALRMDLAHKTVVTNNLRGALLLSAKPGVTVTLLPGTVEARTGSVIGATAVRRLCDLRFDLMLVSCAGIRDGAAFDHSPEQNEIKRTAFENSRHRLLLADGSKFSLSAAYRLFPLCDFDAVATDREPPAAERGAGIRFLLP